MLVQINPWQTTKTSLAVVSSSSSKRKRIRSDNGSSNKVQNGSSSNKVQSISDSTKMHVDSVDSSEEIASLFDAASAVVVPSCVVASFVHPCNNDKRRTSKRRKTKKQQQHSDENPLIILTSPHCVSTIVMSKGEENEHNAAAAVAAATLSHQGIQECSQRYYTSRPGTSTSFFPLAQDHNNSTMLTGTKSQIPVLYNETLHQYHGLQHSNKLFVSWYAHKGPDTCHVKLTLSQPAVSLHLLEDNNNNTNHNNNGCLVYGTAEDGSCFVISLPSSSSGPSTNNNNNKNSQKQQQNEESLQPRLLESENASTYYWTQNNDLQHVSTNMMREKSDDDIIIQNLETRKRKTTSDDVNKNIFLIQTFCSPSSKHLIMIRHRLFMQDEQYCLETVGTSQIPLQVHAKEQLSSLQASITKDDTTLVVGYTCRHYYSSSSTTTTTNSWIIQQPHLTNGNKSKTSSSLMFTTNVLAISLENGHALGHAFQVASSPLQSTQLSLYHQPCQIGTIGNYLAVYPQDCNKKNNIIELYDVHRASIVDSIHLPQDLQHSNHVLMVTNARHNQLGIVYSPAHDPQQQQQFFHVAYTTCELLSRNNDLATGLRFANQIVDEKYKPFTTSNNLLHLLSTNSHDNKDNHQSPQHFVETLQTCIRDHFSDHSSSHSSLLETFCQVIEASESSKSTLCLEKVGSNRSLVNGKGKATTTKLLQQLLDCHKTKKPTFSKRNCSRPLMECFDAIVPLALKTFVWKPHKTNQQRQAKRDICYILYWLVECGSLSTRRHLSCLAGGDDDDDDPLWTLLLAISKMQENPDEKSKVPSPVDFIFGMLSHCTDVSERQMVTMLHFMLTRARPHDIAAHSKQMLLLQSDASQEQYKLVARSFLESTSRLEKAKRKTVDNGHKQTNNNVMSLQTLVEKRSVEVVRAGSVYLVGRLVSYSNCNESLLKSALAKVLLLQQRDCEPTVMAQVVVDCLGKVTGGGSNITKWLNGICDICRERDDESTRNDLDYILGIIRHARRCTESFVSLKPVAASVLQQKQEKGKSTDAVPGQEYIMENLTI